METFKRAVISAYGGPEVLKIVEDRKGQPTTGLLGIRVLGSGVAFGDVLKREGKMPSMPSLPYTPGYDFIGRVEFVGPDSQYSIGQKVAGLVPNGANTEYILVKEKYIIPVDDSVDTAEGVATCLNYVTAWQMLTRVAKAQPGERLLIHGAGGGVGTALMQLGKLLGLEMYGTASKGKHEILKQHNTQPIDYKSEDFVKVVNELPNPGVDIVIDGIGGKTLGRSYEALRKNGRLISYGISASTGSEALVAYGTFARLFWYWMKPDSRKAFFYIVVPNIAAKMSPVTKSSNNEEVREDLKLMFQYLKEKKIHPIVGATFSLRQIVEAHRAIDNASVPGKIVLMN